MLRHLPDELNPSLLAGTDIGDDAGIYRLTDDLALVQTVDFFTPIVDDPYMFGRIAAANSLSDIYAVGGTPITALNIAGFPIGVLPKDVLADILRGGADVAHMAGVSIVGGHTIDDQEPKYGLAVTGTVHPDKFLTGRGARPGDLLILTKPIGTGLVATAHKNGHVAMEDLAQAVAWMTTLNREASIAMLSAGAHACTDITGFGLLGHLVELARSSGTAAELTAGAMPLLPGALRYARLGYVPGGTRTNETSVEPWVEYAGDIDLPTRSLLNDPQTSGGLLISLPSERLVAFRAAAGGGMLSAVVGRLREGSPGTVSVAP